MKTFLYTLLWLTIIIVTLVLTFRRPRISMPSFHFNLGRLVMILVIVAMGFWAYKTLWDKVTGGDSSAVVTSTPSPRYEEALVLRKECFTPCAVNAPYVFDVDAQGDPVTLRIPLVRGGDTLVSYSGKGERVPTVARRNGEIQITSFDPSKIVRVRILEVTTILQRR